MEGCVGGERTRCWIDLDTLGGLQAQRQYFDAMRM